MNTDGTDAVFAAIHLLHPRTDSGQCRTCREPHPCGTLRVIDKAVA